MEPSLALLTAILCGLLLVLSLFRRKRRRASGRHERYRKKAEAAYSRLQDPAYSDAQKLSYLRNVNPYVFEELVLLAFQNKGVRIKRNQRYSGDGGIDGRLYAEGKEYLLQCKRYRTHIRQSDVLAFARLCDRKRVGGYFIHTGRTGQAAWKTVEEFKTVEIVSGRRLLRLLTKEQ